MFLEHFKTNDVTHVAVYAKILNYVHYYAEISPHLILQYKRILRINVFLKKVTQDCLWAVICTGKLCTRMLRPIRYR